MVSAAGAPGYALDYPNRLNGERALLEAYRKQAAELPAAIDAHGRELKVGPNPELLLVIMRQADEAGRTEAYDSANDAVMGVNAFWEDERGPITARVNGAAQKHVTEAGCTQQVELGGPISYALKDGVDRQLEKRLRAHNEAQRTIDREKAALGTANAAVARELADEIARSSYLVYVAIVEERDAVQRLLAERSDVESTLERSIGWERQLQEQSGTSAAEKKASQERLIASDNSLVAIPNAAAAAEAAVADLDVPIEEARKKHEDALARLEQALQAQAAQAQQQSAAAKR